MAAFFIDEYLSASGWYSPKCSSECSYQFRFTQKAVDFLLSHDEINPSLARTGPKHDDSNHSDCVHIFLLYLSAYLN